MPKTYLYGLVGRHVMIGKNEFYGYKSYPTKTLADKEANDARSMGRLARVVPHGKRYILLVSQKGQRK